MIKTAFLFYLLFFFNGIVYAQKLTLTDTSYQSWQYISGGYTKVSPDGHFFYYSVENMPIGKSTAVITAMDNSWKLASTTLSSCEFTANGNFLYLQESDSLKFIDLKTKKTTFIALCNSYKLLHIGTKEWLLYQPKDSLTKLVVKQLNTNKIAYYEGVDSYLLNSNASVIILRSKSKGDVEQMRWLDLISGKIKEIYSGSNAENFIFDHSGRQMAFISTKLSKNTIWYYQAEQKDARPLLDDSSHGILQNHRIATGEWMFSTDDSELFFTQQPIKNNIVYNNPNLKIWSYQDAFLRSQYQPMDINDRNLSVCNIKNGKIRQLLTGIQKLKNGYRLSTDVMLVQSMYGREDEITFNKYSRPSYYLLFSKTGELRPIKENCDRQINVMELSPDGRYLLYFEQETGSYLSYDINNKQTNTINGITGGVNFYNAFDRNANINKGAAGIIAWIDNNRHALIQGTFDLWVVDPSGKKPAVNFTRIGTNNSIIFNALYKSDHKQLNERQIYLEGYQLKDKAVGLYLLDLKNRGLKTLYINKTARSRPYGELNVFYPTKNGCLIAEQSVASSLNYSFTKDFRTVIPVTNIHPEAQYDWIKADLTHYTDKNGDQCEGILYKPEKFDSSKRYPVILTYYKDESMTLNDFILPEPQSTGFNIPILLSKGYLVFMPNTYQIMGEPGESALNSVLAGVFHLNNYKWIDTANIGICGVSWGGYETNYIVTHSNRFKAVYSAAGVSNMISAYNDIVAGYSWQWPVRRGYYAMIEGLDKRPDQYIRNSPIIFAKDVTSPVLLMHNDGDESVPVTHSIQFFNQLRTLGKPAWLLQYKGEPHGVEKLENKLDLQKKVDSFFKHYLMGAPTPDWMVIHIAPQYE